ncbi:MAG: VOC family protein [Gilvibacter sp.]
MVKDLQLEHVIPVLSTNDVPRDIKWYAEYAGFKLAFEQDGYAGLYRDGIWLHLQYHLGTKDDPVFGSVVKLFVKDVEQVFNEMRQRGTVKADALRKNTPWDTHEFGFYDLNKNAIFFVQDA